MDRVYEDGARFILETFAAVCGEFLQPQQNGLFMGAFDFGKKFFARRRL
jgi:hypothetical protein